MALVNIETLIYCLLIVALGWAVAFQWRLFPSQWRCMYGEEGKEKCGKQCRLCRNIDK